MQPENTTRAEGRTSDWRRGCGCLLGVGAAMLLFAMKIQMLSETAWMFVLGAMPFAVLLKRQFSLRALLGLVLFSASLLTLHVNGYRIYGEPIFMNARTATPRGWMSASSDLELVPPRTLKMNRRLGATSTAVVLFGVTFNTSTALVADSRFGKWESEHRQYETNVGWVVEDAPAKKGSVVRNALFVPWCGNSYFPRFFPEIYPATPRCDLGKVLVSIGLATPDWEQLKDDPEYAKTFEKYRQSAGK